MFYWFCIRLAHHKAWPSFADCNNVGWMLCREIVISLGTLHLDFEELWTKACADFCIFCSVITGTGHSTILSVFTNSLLRLCVTRFAMLVRSGIHQQSCTEFLFICNYLHKTFSVCSRSWYSDFRLTLNLRLLHFGWKMWPFALWRSGVSSRRWLPLSGDCSAFIFRVEMNCDPISNLKVKAVLSSETLGISCKITRSHNPQSSPTSSAPWEPKTVS